MKFKINVLLCIITLVFSLVSTSVIAQIKDSIFGLPSVEISHSRITLFNTGIQINELDSAILENSANKTMGDILSSSSTVFIKTYGAGGSATISSRGTEARHTSVLWNGFNINSSSLGVTDIANIPGSITNNVKLISGGSSPVNGNSAIGGSLILENNPATYSGKFNTNINIDAGSFGNRHLSINPFYSNKYLESRTVIFINKSDNDFEFVNEAKRNKDIEELTNAKVQNYGILQDFDFKIKPNQFLEAGIWYQVNDREIPPAMTIPVSVAEQRDRIFRAYAGYRLVLNKFALHFKGAYFNEYQFYTDSIHNLDQVYLVSNYLAEAEYLYHFNEKLILNNGISYINSVADIKEYAQSQSRFQLAWFSNAAIIPFEGWKLNLNLRAESNSGENPPLSPSIGFTGKIYKNIVSVSGNAGRHFNLPSMNELYWVPGGNINLKPENAWSYEAGVILFEKNKSFPEITLNYFYSLVDDWIKWIPVTGGIYAPVNLQQVQASGFESNIDYKKSFKDFRLITSVKYSYTRSILKKSYNNYDQNLIGNQLIYIPEHSANFICTVQYHSYSLTVNNTFTGERFTTDDNQQSLPYFNLMDAHIEKKFKIRDNSLNIFIEVHNILDAKYQVLAYRPTPGRWYEAGIKINLNHI